MDRSAIRQNLIGRIGIPVEENVIYAGDIRTYYISAGRGQPILLIHGHSSTGAISLKSVIASLAHHFRVIAPDVVGYGETDKPSAPYDRYFFSAWLKDFVRAIELRRASLVGFSQGGAISIQFTLEEPERVDRLVLVNSAGLGKFFPPLGFLISTILRYSFPSRLACRWHSSYITTNSGSIDEEMLDYGLKVSLMPGARRSFWQGRGRAVSPFPPEILSQISHPTLLLCGEKDRVVSPVLSERAQKIMPNAKFQIIQDSGHSPFFDQPELFSNILVKFLKGDM